MITYSNHYRQVEPRVINEIMSRDNINLLEL